MGWNRGGGGSVQPLVPLCLFDKSNRWPLTVSLYPDAGGAGAAAIPPPKKNTCCGKKEEKKKV